MRKPIHLDTAERRRRKRREDRAREVKDAAGRKCQDCGEPHGKLIPLSPDTYHRIELRIVHLDRNRDNWRRDNLRVVCGHCWPSYFASFSSAEASHPNGEAR